MNTINAIARLVMLVLCTVLALQTRSWLFWGLAGVNMVLLAGWLFMIAIDKPAPSPVSTETPRRA